MNLESIARAYASCVEIDERAHGEMSEIAQSLDVLRSDLHAILMASLREANIPFTDRQDAARIAFDIAAGRRAVA